MNERDEELVGPDIEAMLGLGDGVVSRGLERLQLARNARLRVGRLAVLLAAVTWIPLLVLTIAEGVAWGDRAHVPFMMDYLPYGQLLIAVPVLVFGELTVARYLVLAVGELRCSEVLAVSETEKLDGLAASTAARWRGRTVNVVILILTLAFTLVSLVEAREWLTGGWQVAGDGMTMAGWWYLLISLPVMRFLAMRWLWRVVLWAWFLWRLSRMDLEPRPAHPDRAGGLAFLGGTQAALGILVFAFGVQLSCLIADSVHFRGAELTAFRGEMVAFMVLVVIVFLMPLVVFAPKMVRVREKYLLSLSSDAHRGAGDLVDKLGARQTGEMPTDAVSGLSDFGTLYENARLMRPLPLEIRHIVILVLAAVVPFLPLIFLVMPAQEVVQTLLRLLV
jgi:hypothetical protein